MLAKLQMWLFTKGADKNHFFYERIGNFVQDIRTILMVKRSKFIKVKV